MHLHKLLLYFPLPSSISFPQCLAVETKSGVSPLDPPTARASVACSGGIMVVSNFE